MASDFISRNAYLFNFLISWSICLILLLSPLVANDHLAHYIELTRAALTYLEGGQQLALDQLRVE